MGCCATDATVESSTSSGMVGAFTLVGAVLLLVTSLEASLGGRILFLKSKLL
jgi:hypothetical protein